MKILRREHLALTKWALNPTVSVLRDRSEGMGTVEKATSRQRQRLEQCSQKPKVARGQQKLEESSKSLSPEAFWRAREPASTLTTDICPSQLRENTFLLFKPPGV